MTFGASFGRVFSPTFQPKSIASGGAWWLAGDTSTPDWTTRWFELAALKPATADRTIDVDASGQVIVASSPGGTSKVYTLTDSVSGLPIADVHVWVSTDTAGANVVASGYTDVSGQVTFMLDAGTYYLWRQKAGYNFVNPDTEVVA